MISIYPTIYHEFQCKADQCENTCCQLWTIDIDEPTAERYHSMTGSLGESLRQAITVDDEGSHFIFSKAQPMCPLLNEKGLCKVVLELGEEGLCDTCHMHPRFYKYIEDLELCGVGLSCEASVELLAQQEPLDSFKELLDLYKQTEPIDENWTAQVNTLSSKLDQLIASVQTYIQQEDMSLFNKVYQYILYRQIDMLSDYSFESILAYAKDGTDYILIASALEGQPLKQVARWSQQIEYDENNVELLLQHYEAQLGE